ncbi:hypothetical protein F5880DRAFT_390702 [Lentinula raphanica]|nr:hypothetical protein F5880DRAFT_390702 [Lentinula raphanica]
MFQRNQYQAQLEADEAAAAARRLEEEEQQKIREAEQRQRDNEAAQEQEKRRAPLYNFTDGQSISKIPRHLHPYAQRRISQRKFVELWYFTPEATEEARDQRRKPETSTFRLATNEDEDGRDGAAAFTLIGTHSTRPSPNVKPDSELTWEQILRAKTVFLNALPNGGYPPRFVDMFAQFYVNLDLHDELDKVDGDKLLILYHAEMRRAWYLANEHGKPFDLSIISTPVMEQCREDIREMKTRRQERATRRQERATLGTQSLITQG